MAANTDITRTIPYDGGHLDIGGATVHMYSYQKLQSPSHFRIFKLLPRSYVPPSSSLPEAAIHGSLLERSVEEGIPYECLSYTWGMAPIDQAIFLDGQIFPITVNLAMALGRLQAATEPRYVWIDALCINQTDIEERNQQVKLMYTIYSTASMVTIYLGEEGGDSRSIPELLDKIRHAHFHIDPDLSHMWSSDQYHSLGLPPVDDEIWDCLPAFLSRPWFTRVWVLQEALAAKKLHVMCGDWSATAVGPLGEPGLLESLMLADIHGLPTGGEYSKREAMNSAVRGHKQLWFMAKLGLGGMGGGTELHQQRRSLLALLVSTRGAASTDKRDRVFALLNLCNDAAALKIEPDYHITVEEAYRRVARALVKAGQGGRLLLYAHPHNNNLRMASWIPDWSQEEIPWYDIVSPPVNADIPDSEDHGICLGESEDHLTALGITLGTIRALHTLEAEKGNLGMHIQRLREPLELQHRHATVFESAEIPSAKKSAGNMESIKQGVSSSANDSSSRHVDTGLQSIRSQILPMARFAATAETWIGSSPQYKASNTDEVKWKTLLCYHAHSPSMGLPEDCHGCYESFGEFANSLFNESYARGQMLTSIIQEIARSQGLSRIEVSEESLKALGPAIAALQPWYRKKMEVRQQKANEFISAMQRFCFTYQLGVLKEGYVGMLPPAAKEKDLIVCVKGVKAPMVLRHARDQGSFEVIGHAFFHGFMPSEKRLQDLEKNSNWQELTLA